MPDRQITFINAGDERDWSGRDGMDIVRDGFSALQNGFGSQAEAGKSGRKLINVRAFERQLTDWDRCMPAVQFQPHISRNGTS
ncbi:hypothetical protein GCM10008012_61120 [Rhizobium anhuiense]|jgi:hypothetical protein|nr:hypothetical protein GCM10008012_61120 [Rhizobium anhuiense]